MTGRELIKWIHENKAEDLQVIVEHRDTGGSYNTAEHVDYPVLADYGDELHGIIYRFTVETQEPTAILL